MELNNNLKSCKNLLDIDEEVLRNYSFKCLFKVYFQELSILKFQRKKMEINIKYNTKINVKRFTIQNPF